MFFRNVVNFQRSSRPYIANLNSYNQLFSSFNFAIFIFPFPSPLHLLPLAASSVSLSVKAFLSLYFHAGSSAPAP
jgi:hypothetical protein